MVFSPDFISGALSSLGASVFLGFLKFLLWLWLYPHRLEISLYNFNLGISTPKLMVLSLTNKNSRNKPFVGGVPLFLYQTKEDNRWKEIRFLKDHTLQKMDSFSQLPVHEKIEIFFPAKYKYKYFCGEKSGQIENFDPHRIKKCKFVIQSQTTQLILYENKRVGQLIGDAMKIYFNNREISPCISKNDYILIDTFMYWEIYPTFSRSRFRKLYHKIKLSIRYKKFDGAYPCNLENSIIYDFIKNNYRWLKIIIGNSW